MGASTVSSKCILAHTFLKEVRLAVERNQLHPRERVPYTFLVPHPLPNPPPKNVKVGLLALLLTSTNVAVELENSCRLAKSANDENKQRKETTMSCS